MSAEERLEQLGLVLPTPSGPLGVYKPMVVLGNLAYLSGHGPLTASGSMMVGRVGRDVDLAGGRAAARQTALALLATLRAQLGNLDRVQRVVKLFGMVNCEPDFTDQPAVINGASELLRELFGADRGVGVRSAVGVGALPGNITTEIEALFEIG